MLSIIIPCYNEADNIPHLITACLQAMPASFSGEIILVNNGSTDNTSDILTQYIPANSVFRTIDIEKNKGYGHGILTGLAAARGEVLAWTHADCQTDPQDVFRAYDRYLQHGQADVFVKGHRIGRRYSEWFFSAMMQAIASICLRTRLTDINAQPKLFSRAFYKRHIQNQAPEDFSLDLYVLLQATRHRSIDTIPVFFHQRTRGEAKGGGSMRTRIRLINRTLRYIIQLAKKVAL